MTVRERLFLVAGTNFTQRKLAIDNIKKKILKGKDASFNIFTFYGKEVSLKSLQEKIFTFSFDKERAVVFKNADLLPKEIKGFLFQDIKRVLLTTHVILEIEKDYSAFAKEKKTTSNEFFSFALKNACIFKIGSMRVAATIDDFRMSLRRNDLQSALYSLDGLFNNRNQGRDLGPLILGILVSKISYLYESKNKNRYFKYLWQADRAIKEKGIEARLAIEVLLVKLLKT
ncbi:MAG: hypothetical protein GY858_05685 [Candidatus Omnitrophica bacterium]|nr:hypothetical protein [Candidatus Omnitrophota bacterium]